jgi:hypothetical protein
LIQCWLCLLMAPQNLPAEVFDRLASAYFIPALWRASLCTSRLALVSATHIIFNQLFLIYASFHYLIFRLRKQPLLITRNIEISIKLYKGNKTISILKCSPSTISISLVLSKHDFNFLSAPANGSRHTCSPARFQFP